MSKAEAEAATAACDTVEHEASQWMCRPARGDVANESDASGADGCQRGGDKQSVTRWLERESPPQYTKSLGGHRCLCPLSFAFYPSDNAMSRLKQRHFPNRKTFLEEITTLVGLPVVHSGVWWWYKGLFKRREGWGKLCPVWPVLELKGRSSEVEGKTHKATDTALPRALTGLWTSADRQRDTNGDNEKSSKKEV